MLETLYIKVFVHIHTEVLQSALLYNSYKTTKFLFKGTGTIYKSLLKLRKRASRYLSLFSPNRLCLFKSQAHAANYCKFKLISDIEKNPGPTPMQVDSSKTIAVPYSQGDELVFGQNTMSSNEFMFFDLQYQTKH